MKIYFDIHDMRNAKLSLPNPAAWDEGIATTALDALIVLANGGTVEGLDFTAEGKSEEEIVRLNAEARVTDGDRLADALIENEIELRSGEE